MLMSLLRVTRVRAREGAGEQGVKIILPTYTAVGYAANLTVDKKTPPWMDKFTRRDKKSILGANLGLTGAS